MCLDLKLCLVILGYFCSSIVLNNCRKLDGYKFPVYKTTFCPRIESEWTERSLALNCNKSNGYMCLPNDNFDELLEFCYREPVVRIQKGFCLYLVKRVSLVHSYSCSHFTQGCHNHPFFSNEHYNHPACVSIGDGCFLAEPSCKGKTSFRILNGTRHFENVSTNEWNGSTKIYLQLSSERPQLENTPINDDNAGLLVPVILGISFLLCILSLLFGFYMKGKYQICRTSDDVERPEETNLKKSNSQARNIVQSNEEMHREEEIEPLLGDGKPDNKSTNGHGQQTITTSESIEGQLPSTSLKEDKVMTVQESKLEKHIFDQWKQDDLCFILTKACKEVEKNVKSMDLVIVAGHSGSGKSAIIQHIALKYREQGWTVKRVKKVEDIINEYSASSFQENKTICVFNDPLGKESFDEQMNSSWETYEEEVELYLKTAKLVMSCRNHVISDNRVARYLLNQSQIVNIVNNKHKLSVGEKRQILMKHTSNQNISDKDCNKIVEVEMYFPLLCKLFSSKEKYKNKGIEFFTEPVTVLKEEVIGFRKKDKGKYCALALLVLFDDSLCVSKLLKDKDTENKFKHTLKLCGLPKRTSPSAIGDNLNSMKDFFVKKIDDTYHFYHDLVMEVTTYVFGRDYPAETIKFADIGFLRRRVKFGNDDERDDPFDIYLSDSYTEELGNRLYTEMFEERLLDVVLNPCLRNEKVIKVLKEKILENREKLQMLLKTKKLAINKQELDRTSKNLLLTKLSFLNLEKEVSPLFALIAFCHTNLSQYCLNSLQQTDVMNIISALYCNGSPDLLFTVFKDYAKEHSRKIWGRLCPVHIVSVFHNYELLGELITVGVDVNKKTDDYGGWTPLMLAAGNNTQECGYYYNEKSVATRRDDTVQLLLTKGADINLCMENGFSPLHIACQHGHDSTVQLLLTNGADINLCMKDGASPLSIGCQNGHDSTVHILLSNGADTNLCMEDGASPLYIACQNGHDSTVQLLLTNRADINSCKKNGASPLYIASYYGHDSTVQLLLSKGADINLCTKDGASPLHIACQNGHNITVQLLLTKKADINLFKKNGTSPLFIACQNGHDSTLQILLTNGADVNLCMKDGTSPLHIACFNGHDSTVQILLTNEADINLCKKNGASPLHTACQNGHESAIHLLLANGADINLCMEDGASPIYIACQNGHDSTVQLLLTYGADINLCKKNGASPLHTACQNGLDSTIQLLLANGADINLCMEDGASPLYIACQNGHDSTLQLLLTNGADINLCKENEASPLYIASYFGYNSTVELLLTNGADINLCMENGFSPLHIACQHGHDSTVQLLLTYGADINLCMKDGASPLYMACQNGYDSTVQLLLANGADINLYSENGASSLHIACQNGHDSTVQFLLLNGADINLCMENGASPLHIACQNGPDSTVQLLLINGADINSCTKDGFSPLYIACDNGHDSIVQLLLTYGADINLRIEKGVSVLYIAFVHRRYKTVNILRNNGVDTTLACGWEFNPALVDCFDKNESTVKFLMRKDNIQNNLYDPDSFFSLFVSCQVERVTRMIFEN